MTTAVYLSSQNIQILRGDFARRKAKISQVYNLTVPEESLINGVITDEPMLREALGEFWKKNRLPMKDVTLVVNSSQLVVKPVELPKMKPQGLVELLKNEFADVERQTDPVYGYCILPQTGNAMNLLAVMAERSFLEGYIRLFKEIGVEVGALYPAVQSAVRFLEQIPSLQNQTCIIQLIDDTNLSNILWMDGKYEYTSRTRLFNERGSTGFWDEVGRTVNNLQQFYSSLKREEPLKEIHVGGMEDEGLSLYVRNMQNLGLSVYPLEVEDAVTYQGGDESISMGDYAFLLGSLYPAKKDWNLLKTYKKSYKSKESWKRLWIRLLPVILGVLILSMATALLAAWQDVLQKTADEMVDFLADADNITNSIYSDDLRMNIMDYSGRIQVVQEHEQVLKSYPIVDSQVENAVIRAGGGIVSARVISYDGNRGALKVEAIANQADDSNYFIFNLFDLELFSNVEYTGYTYDEGREVYRLSVTCYLKQQEGEEDED